ncbi:DUF3238 domain-containing protein [Sporosarcina pasteurii]|uniref:DUF3238 domain-containing protein n=1 Tax=Sporosarcina pasteurii TaxID=1474 RepID=A0A380CJF8_SPOPA|nr:DUF3238 domain-containing protein [Sporosarcina pasteurii]MDS9471955.1 DUF3238 domain-containing protein [Sporosarcina pasteurii]QBQ06686.1 DUF3238 domain-containing protein [Sporosarcina pasteurii]SUJ21687.1 Uncharacterised protein [Sporosarcina pasteurii]
MVNEALFEVQTVTHKHDVIHFTWRDLGGNYYVYRDGELLYEGTVAEFKDGDFKHAKLYNYSIERVVNEEVVDVVRLQTSAYAEERNVKNPLQFLVMTTIVAKSQIALSWEKIKDVSHYEIYRNDVFIKEVQKNQYIDRDISMDQTYTYRIQSKRPLAMSEERFSKGKSVAATVLGMMNKKTSQKQPAIERFTVTKEIGRPRELLIPTLQRTAKSKVNEWQFRYTTFLKEEMIKNPNFFSKNHLFKGDARDFNPDGTSFRTRVDVSLDYGQVKSPMVCTRNIGMTVAYDHVGRIRKEAQATSDGVVLERSDHKPGEAGFLLMHEVQNPLVQAPKINYEVRAVLRRDGTFDMTGYHNQAPHHEVYLVRGAQNGWIPIHLAESNGLIWMSDVMSWHYWRFSNFE